MSGAQDERQRGFTQEDGFVLLAEVARMCDKAREAVEAERYVEAVGWADRIADVLADQDILADLAAGEVIRVSDGDAAAAQ